MITLVFCGDLKYCPYIKRYIERLDEKKADYEVLFWNRGNFTLDLPENYFYYDSPSDQALGKVRKLFDFYGFKKWVDKHIASHKCDGIIFLSTLTAIMLSDDLDKFKDNFIFDIRDYSYEHIGFFRKIEEKAIRNSFFTSISSKGFKSFLPEYDYVIAHNFNRCEIPEAPRFIKKEVPLRLVWNGTVRYFDFQKKYLDALKNDERFELVYHGSGTDLEKYREYCEKNDIKNVLFTGPYDNREKENLLKDAAILNNCYGAKNSDKVKHAVSNRFYDGLIYRIPQLVETGSFKAGFVQKTGTGIALDAADGFADKLYSYYMSINEKEFEAACENVLNEVICEDNRYISMIDSFIEKINQE